MVASPGLGIHGLLDVLQQIPGSTYWDAKGLYNISGGCSNVANQPTVSFKIGGQDYAIPPSLWIIRVTPPPLLLHSPISAEATFTYLHPHAMPIGVLHDLESRLLVVRKDVCEEIACDSQKLHEGVCLHLSRHFAGDACLPSSGHKPPLLISECPSQLVAAHHLHPPFPPGPIIK